MALHVTAPRLQQTRVTQAAANKEERRKEFDPSDTTAANLSRLRSMRAQFERAIDQLQSIRR